MKIIRCCDFFQDFVKFCEKYGFPQKIMKKLKMSMWNRVWNRGGGIVVESCVFIVNYSVFDKKVVTEKMWNRGGIVVES